MKNKKVILACIILLVISLVVIGVVLYTSPYNKALRKIKEINATTKIEEANVYTVDIYKLFNIYKGDLTSEVISKTYENFAVNIIPRYYKACSGLDENGINKYYDSLSKLGSSPKEEILLKEKYTEDEIKKNKEKMLKAFDAVYKDLKNTDMQKENWIKIFLKKDIEEYKRVSAIYIKTKLFNTNDNNVEAEGKTYGSNNYN